MMADLDMILGLLQGIACGLRQSQTLWSPSLSLLRVPAISGWFISLAMAFIVHDAELIITTGSHPQF
jgi:hypothetical protein